MYPMSSRNIGCLIVAPNVVGDGAFFRGLPPTHQFPKPNLSTDTQDGGVPSCDGQKRPEMLDVKNLNGLSSKSLNDPDDEIEDGSLPCTPEMHPDMETDIIHSGHAGDEAVENDTRQLISTFLKDFTGLSNPRWSDSKALSTMKRVVKDVLTKHQYVYNGFINKLSLKINKNDMTFVGEVAKSTFSDGITNWGRIVSLVAFGASVCQHLKENGREHCVELVSEEISSYLLTHRRKWLVDHKSWDGFVEFFQTVDNDSSVTTTLKAFAAFAGIGATLAMLIR